jgi:ketosteroid isomerase-like protein
MLERASVLLLTTLLPALSVPALAAQDATAWFQSTTQRLFDAVAAGDKRVWDEVLDQDCTITTEDGEVLQRGKFLADLRPLPPGFSGQIKVRGLTVRALGDVAVVHYWLDEVEMIFDQRLQTTYVETDTYRRQGTGWKAVAMQETVVPRDLEPIAVDRAGWPALLGDYRYSEHATSRYRVFIRDNQLYGGRDAEHATQLIQLAPLVFYQQGSIHILVFVRGAAGAITEVRELHKYNEVRMKRVPAAGGS